MTADIVEYENGLTVANYTLCPIKENGPGKWKVYPKVGQTVAYHESGYPGFSVSRLELAKVHAIDQKYIILESNGIEFSAAFQVSDCGNEGDFIAFLKALD